MRILLFGCFICFFFNVLGQENINKAKYDSINCVINSEACFYDKLQKVFNFSDSLTIKYKELLRLPFDLINSEKCDLMIKQIPEYYEIKTAESFSEQEFDSINLKVTNLIVSNFADYYEWLKSDSAYQNSQKKYYSTLASNNKTVTVESLIGTYEKVEITSFKIIGLDTIPDYDTTQFIIKKDSTFIYKWSPKYGKYSNEHIESNGKWKFENEKIVFNTKYQQDEYRVFEYYKPEFGDSLTKIYVQTYDSLIGFFKTQFINVLKNNERYPFMIFPDEEYPDQRCVATFKLPNVDKILFRGDFGRMPIIEPKNKKANCFVLQYNLSTNWDYQYMKNMKWDFNGTDLSKMTYYGKRIILNEK